MDPKFVHLRVHSEYSLANGVVRIKPLVKAAVQMNMPALTLTDQSNMFGLVKFYRACQSAGIKPLMGVDAWVYNEDDHNRPHRLVMLSQNDEGYKNLTRLVTKSYIKGQHYGMPMMEKSWFAGNTDHVIALSAGRAGDVGQALITGNKEIATRLAHEWAELFPDRFYLELQRTGRESEERYIHEAVELAIQHDFPVVATNDVHFLKADDFDAHEARVCIHEGRTLDDPRRAKHFSRQQYFRSQEEMLELFADIPEALENSVEIAKRCNLELTLGKPVLPDFPIPEGLTEDEFFRQESHKGLKERCDILFRDLSEEDKREQYTVYEERLNIELDVILGMGFPGYFLIVADFIQWAKKNDVPVGPGRGSGAGSLVAYALKITDLDPIKYDLLFERFLNPERVSMPDFDVDFCMDGRDRVIDYVVQTYGRERVSQIITYGSMAAKAVVRDVGRVLGHPYGFVDKLAKLIPFELGITLDKALEMEEQLKTRYDEEEDVRALIDLARSLEGMTRNAGKHAGGVVIAPTALTDFSPLYCEQDSTSTVTQFDKDDVEAVGLVKFDFLGLRTLTIIDWAVKTIMKTSPPEEGKLDINLIPLDDKDAFRLLKDCQTTAVFQLESRGMKDLIKRLQPDCFEDIVALVALFRPGPLQSGMVDDFINRKHGRTEVVYPHPDLEPILQPTYGVILYQEQVMQIAQVLANYSLGGADLLRRAMGKKKPEEMQKQREIFTKGALERGVEEGTATYIFDLMEKFAGYGFNKSHSAAYALLSYQTAWLKAHYPAAFMSAVLSADLDNTDKVVTLIDECRSMKLSVRPPDINLSQSMFTVRPDGRIQYGLGAIKGVGTSALDSVVAERGANGSFKNLFDFCARIDLRKVNRRMLEALIRAGALDELGANRASLMASLASAVQAAEQKNRDASAGQVDLFGNALNAPSENDDQQVLEEMPEWPEAQRLLGEKETLGLYLTGHPINRYLNELSHFTSARLAELKPNREQKVFVAGLVIGVRAINTKKGDRMAVATIDDKSGRLEIIVYTEGYKQYQDRLIKDNVLVIEGAVELDDYSGGLRMVAERIFDIDEARSHFSKCIMINVTQPQFHNGFINHFADVLAPFKEGGCPVVLHYESDQAVAEISLGNEWVVNPSDELLHRLHTLLGEQQVRIVY